MGTSFTEFKGKGFWTRDSILEVWLGALVQEIDHLPSRPEWLTRVRQDWHLQAVVGFWGCINPKLDEWVTTEEEKHLLIAISEQAMTTLASYGDMIPLEVLNEMTIDEAISPEKPSFIEDVSTEAFLLVGRAFTQLLKENSPQRPGIVILLVGANIHANEAEGIGDTWYHDA